MAYLTSNPPALISGMLNGQGQTWVYRSIDAPTLVRVSGYISNGAFLGMRVGDVVRVIDTDASPVTQQLMNVVSTNLTTGAVDLSDGVAITATNTD